MRVFIAEALEPVRNRLKGLVKEQPGFDVVGLAADLDGLLLRLKTTRPHLLLLGSRLADASSFEALRRAAGRLDGMCIVVLCTRLDGQYLYSAKSLGADYVLESPRDIDILPSLMRQLAIARRRRQAFEKTSEQMRAR